MPTYNYYCSSCDHSFDIQHKMSDNPPPSGPACTRTDCCLQKQLVPVAATFKSANPFTSKYGEPLPIAPTERRKTPANEKAHTCTSGCAMHKH